MMTSVVVAGGGGAAAAVVVLVVVQQQCTHVPYTDKHRPRHGGTQMRKSSDLRRV